MGAEPRSLPAAPPTLSRDDSGRVRDQVQHQTSPVWVSRSRPDGPEHGRPVFDWHDQDLYASPPFPLVPKVLQRLLLMEFDMTLIAPLRWNRSAVSLLLSLLVEVPILLPCRQDLLQQRDASLLHPDPQSLCLHASD